jgi:hypothetical protein
VQNYLRVETSSIKEPNKMGTLLSHLKTEIEHIKGIKQIQQILIHTVSHYCQHWDNQNVIVKVYTAHSPLSVNIKFTYNYSLLVQNYSHS